MTFSWLLICACFLCMVHGQFDSEDEISVSPKEVAAVANIVDDSMSGVAENIEQAKEEMGESNTAIATMEMVHYRYLAQEHTRTILFLCFVGGFILIAAIVLTLRYCLEYQNSQSIILAESVRDSRHLAKHSLNDAVTGSTPMYTGSYTPANNEFDLSEANLQTDGIAAVEPSETKITINAEEDPAI